MDHLTPAQIGMLVMGALGLMFMVQRAWSFEKSFAERIAQVMQANAKPQSVSVQSPLVVTAEERFVSREELESISTRLDKIDDKIETLATEIRDNQEERGKAIHERINALLEAVAELRGEVRRMGHPHHA